MSTKDMVNEKCRKIEIIGPKLKCQLSKYERALKYYTQKQAKKTTFIQTTTLFYCQKDIPLINNIIYKLFGRLEFYMDKPKKLNFNMDSKYIIRVWLYMTIRVASQPTLKGI